jgi:hypothetical protein
MTAIEIELGLSSGTGVTLDLDNTNSRSLALLTTPGSPIMYSNFYGKSAYIAPTTWTTSATTSTAPFTSGPTMKPYITFDGTNFNYTGTTSSTAYNLSSSDGYTWTVGSNMQSLFSTSTYKFPVNTPIYNTYFGKYYMCSAAQISSTAYQVRSWYGPSPNSPTSWINEGIGQAQVTSTNGLQPVYGVSAENLNGSSVNVGATYYSLYTNSTTTNHYVAQVFNSYNLPNQYVASSFNNIIPSEVQYYNGNYYILTTQGTYNATTLQGGHPLFILTNTYTWTNVPVASRGQAYLLASGTSVYSNTLAISSNGIFAAGFSDGAVTLSTDGANTWTTIMAPGAYGTNVNSLCWCGTKYLLAALPTGIYLTVDYGVTWVKVSTMAADGFAVKPSNITGIGVVTAVQRSPFSIQYANFK